MEMKDILKAHTAAVEAKVDKAENTALEAKVRMDELEQKMARVGRGAPPVRSWGSEFIQAKAQEIAQVALERGRVSMEIKATVTGATTDAAGSAGDLSVPQRDTLLMMPKRRLTIRNLLNVVNANSGSVEYPKQAGFTNNAGMVAEGALKPQSDIQFTLETVPLRVIAHHVKASRQVLEDVPQLMGLIDTELRYGLALKEESQLLYGDGTDQNLDGMVTQAAAFAAPITVTQPNMIDTLGLAILQASLTDVPVDGIVIHPSDWWAMRLLKNADGEYILGDPQSQVAPGLFGLPVVPTQAMGAGDFLVGGFSAQTLYDRWSARVEVGFVEDDFTRNLVTVLGEERIGLATKRPEALIFGSFSDGE